MSSPSLSLSHCGGEREGVSQPHSTPHAGRAGIGHHWDQGKECGRLGLGWGCPRPHRAPRVGAPSKPGVCGAGKAEARPRGTARRQVRRPRADTAGKPRAPPRSGPALGRQGRGEAGRQGPWGRRGLGQRGPAGRAPGVPAPHAPHAEQKSVSTSVPLGLRQATNGPWRCIFSRQRFRKGGCWTPTDPAREDTRAPPGSHGWRGRATAPAWNTGMPGPRAGCGPRPAGAVTRGRGTCGPSPGHRAILRGQISLSRRLVGGERRSAPVQGTQKASWSMDLHCTRPWGWAFWERESGLPCARTWPVGQGPGGGACRRSGTPGHGAAAPADP